MNSNFFLKDDLLNKNYVLLRFYYIDSLEFRKLYKEFKKQNIDIVLLTKKNFKKFSKSLNLSLQLNEVQTSKIYVITSYKFSFINDGDFLFFIKNLLKKVLKNSIYFFIFFKLKGDNIRPYSKLIADIKNLHENFFLLQIIQIFFFIDFFFLLENKNI